MGRKTPPKPTCIREPDVPQTASRMRLVGEPSVPPSANAAVQEKPRPDFSEFDNPIYRFDFMSGANERDRQVICDEFLAGNWYVFGAWAQCVLSGQMSDAQKTAGTPHGAFWSKFLAKTTPQERADFIDFLLKAGLADTGTRYRPAREFPEECTPSCAHWLSEYLEAFQHPVHSPDEGKLLGHRLVHYSHYPDERIIRVAAACLKEKTLAHLARFLGTKRRFFKLHTDYSTDLEELDGLFLETLRALLELASGGAQKSNVEKIFRTAFEENTRKKTVPGKIVPLGSNPDGEQIILEHYSDNQGMAPPDKRVGPSSLPDPMSCGRGPVPKSEWLGLALKALDGDAASQELFFGEKMKFPGASWTIGVDDGAARFFDGTLFYLGHFLFDGHHHLPTLSAIDVKTGNTRFLINLGDRSSGRGLRIWGGKWAAGPSGDIALVTEVEYGNDRKPRRQHIVFFDGRTGQVGQMRPLALSPEKDASELHFAGDGFLMRTENTYWKQGTDGKLLWKMAIPEAEALGGDGKRAILLRKDSLEIFEFVAGKTVLSRARAELSNEAGGGFQPDVVVNANGFCLFDNNKRIYSFDDRANFLWKLEPTPGESWLGLPRSWADTLSIVNFKEFCIIGPDGKVSGRFPFPGRPNDYIVEGKEVFYFTDDALWYWAPGMALARKAVEKPVSHMARPLGVSGGNLLLLFYDGHYYLSCVPVKSLRGAAPKT